MKPFDIKKAAEGHPVCDGAGNAVRILCVDRPNIYCIVGMYINGCIMHYSKLGRLDESFEDEESDLFMAPIKRVRWANVYEKDLIDGPFSSEDTAKRAIEQKAGFIKTIKIEWEE